MKLIFVTSSYPYGTGETFIENEIEYLFNSFDDVIVFPVNCADDDLKNKREVPERVRVYGLRHGKRHSSKFREILNRSFWKEILYIRPGETYLRKIDSCMFFLENVRGCSKEIPNFIAANHFQKSDEIIIYSYWLSTIGMTAINLRDALKKRGVDATLISRCHGFDLYRERAHLGYLPFQAYMLQRFDRIFPCSAQGTAYLREEFPRYREKIETAYLGIPDRFQGKWPGNRPFQIVSCSNVIPVKRVRRIAEALREIRDFNIHWTHFGDGELFDELKAYTRGGMPDTITVNFPGRVNNADIYRYYQEHNVSLFINVSSSEGLPVSIMEACSFGIPVIATDVGGTAEIVQDGVNGILLNEQFETEDLKRAILRFSGMEQQEYKGYCRASRARFETDFSAKKNYPAFCQKLIALAEEKSVEA